MTAFDEILARLDGLESLIRAQAGPTLCWLDLRRAARYAGLSVTTLRRGIETGKLRASRQHGKVLFRPAWIDHFVEGKKR